MPGQLFRSVALLTVLVAACTAETSIVDGDGGVADGSGGKLGSGGSAIGSGGRVTGSGGKLGSGGSATGSGGAITGSGGKLGSGGSIAGSGGAIAGSGGKLGSGGAITGSGGKLGSGGSVGSGGWASLLAPANGAILGGFIGTGTVASTEAQLGRKWGAILHYFGWSDDFTGTASSDISSGHIPYITWEPWQGSVGTPLDNIIGGNYDAMIRQRAQALKNAGGKVLLRWAHEMNGNWYPWDGSHNGSNAAAAQKYISAYRHIHDIFTTAGASNVLFVFCPNVDSVPGETWNTWEAYYPGDTYVDWMCFDGYNWGTTQSYSSWQSFQQIASRIYSGIAAKGKPIMVGETASTETGGNKAAWISALVPALKSSFPAIKMFVWFHVNKETDWRIDSTTATLNAFKTFATDPYMNP